VRRVLVLTTIHHPDDTRIRERLCRTLANEFEVVYASRLPGPSDSAGLTWVPLPGGRLGRNLRALGLVLRRGTDVLVVHDPELIPLALVVRALRRIPVVLDLHEDVPAQIRTKEWLPSPLRPPVAAIAAFLLRSAERFLAITLAEPGYRRLFRKDHLVIPNFPDTSTWPDPSPTGDGSAVYVGDVTPIRGIEVAVAAAGRAGVPLTVVGACGDGFAARIQEAAGRERAEVTLTGRLPYAEAIQRARSASVGVSPLFDVPNYRHSQPTKILEYLAAGVPVVASDLPGTRELCVGLEAVWLVPPGDPDALTVALHEAASAHAKGLAVDQAPEVRSRYAWPKETVLGFYRRLL
jgi:glycosyltransferase involved in cell wall biosynthesis